MEMGYKIFLIPCTQRRNKFHRLTILKTSELAPIPASINPTCSYGTPKLMSLSLADRINKTWIFNYQKNINKSIPLMFTSTWFCWRTKKVSTTKVYAETGWVAMAWKLHSITSRNHFKKRWLWNLEELQQVHHSKAIHRRIVTNAPFYKHTIY